MTFTSIDPTLTPKVLPLAGGTMTGVIAMGGNKITGQANGTASGNSSTGLVNPINYAIITGSFSSSSGYLSIPPYRVSVASTTTIYLKVYGIYTGGTPVYQYAIHARRVR